MQPKNPLHRKVGNVVSYPHVSLEQAFCAPRSGVRRESKCGMKQIARLAVVAVSVAWATGNARASITPSYEDDGKTMVLDVAEDDTLDIAIPSTVTNLVKTGDGKATLTQAAAWTAANCTVEVRGGTLAPGAYANLGAPATVTVLPGGTFDFTGFSSYPYATTYVKTIFYVSGNGFDGAGALRYTDKNLKCHALLKRVVMTGDAKVVGPTHTSALIEANDGFGFGQYKSGSYDANNPQPNLNMNGHTLTIEGGFCFGNSSAANSATLSNPGDIVLLANARLLLASMANLTVNGTGAATWPALNGKTITLNDGAQMMHYMLRDAPTATWKVVVPEGAAARFNLHGNNDKGRAYVYYPFEVDGTVCTLGGIAKGSGMIHINMGTMLSFISTDCAISKELVSKALHDEIADSYNQVSVDGDTSTNDTVVVIANGLAGNPEICETGEAYDAFCEALHTVSVELSKKIAGDGEGCTKLLEAHVTGAPDKETARLVSKSIVCSSLFKAAVFASDANWGRILCAIGYTVAYFDASNIDVSVKSEAGEVLVCKGSASIPFDDDFATEILSKEYVTVEADLHDGDAEAYAWGCDLTYDYVKINGSYRS